MYRDSIQLRDGRPGLYSTLIKYDNSMTQNKHLIYTKGSYGKTLSLTVRSFDNIEHSIEHNHCCLLLLGLCPEDVPVGNSHNHSALVPGRVGLQKSGQNSWVLPS